MILSILQSHGTKPEKADSYAVGEGTGLRCKDDNLPLYTQCIAEENQNTCDNLPSDQVNNLKEKNKNNIQISNVALDNFPPKSSEVTVDTIV